MYPLVCNKCFQHKKEDSTVLFYFSACEHVICASCVDSRCPACSRPYNPIVICKDMPVKMANLFVSSQKLYDTFKKAVKFQIEQDALIFKYYYENMPNLVKKLQKERNALVKVEKKISIALSVENQRITKLKKYLAYNERRLEQASVSLLPRSQPTNRSGSRGRASSIGSAAPMFNRYRVQTPTLSLTDSNEEKNGSNE